MTFSIGDVLEQLSDEFPDITVSKIRFLESQGLISPMRTASGFRMFSDRDITKLKWILLNQRDRFLPLKVIKEYLANVSDDDFNDGNMPHFDFESSGALALEGNEQQEILSVQNEQAKHLTSVPDIPSPSQSNVAAFKQRSEENPEHPLHEKQIASTLVQEAPKTKSVASTRKRPDATSTRQAMRSIPQSYNRDSYMNQLDLKNLKGSTEAMVAKKEKVLKTKSKSMLKLEEMTIETGISGPQLKELVRFGVLDATGTGNAIVFSSEEVGLANTILPLLERGLEVRHLKNYMLFAGREVGFLEHVVEDDLRRRNPEANAKAQEKAKQFIQDTARLKEYLLIKAIRQESK